MSEVIKAILEADATDLQAELQKASAAVANFEQKARRARDVGMPVAELSPAYFKQMDQAAAVAGKMQASMRGLGGSAGNAGYGFLQLAQFADDAQYGMRGILNNIPGLVMGFGGGMGVAGAVSLGALAISRIIPLFEKLSGAADDRALKDSVETWNSVYSASMKAAEGIREAAEAERAAASLSNEWKQALDARFQVGSQMDGFWNSSLEAAKQERSLTLEILRAREAIIKAGGGDTTGIQSKIAAVESAGNEADLENRRKALAQVEADLIDLVERRKVLSAETAEGEIQSTNALVDAKQRLARYEADLAAAEKLRASIKPLSGLGSEAAEAAAALGPLSLLGVIGQSALDEKKADQDTLKNLATNAAIYRDEIAKITAEIAALEATAAASGPAAAEKLAQLDAAIAKRDGETKAITEQIKALESLKQQQAALAEIENQRRALEADQASLSELQKAQPKLERAAEQAAAQDQASDAILDEIDIMRTQLEQGAEKARQLKEEINLRKQAAEIAKQTGLAAEDAQRIAEEQLRLQQQLAAPAGPTGSIKERREARSAERAAERERKRNERVAEAERKRKEKNADGKKDEQGDIDLAKIREQTERAKNEAERKLRENGAAQLKALQSIEKRLNVLEKLATA